MKIQGYRRLECQGSLGALCHYTVLELLTWNGFFRGTKRQTDQTQLSKYNQCGHTWV